MGTRALLLLFICSLCVYCNGIGKIDWNLSQEEDLELERQLKLLSKPAIRTITTDDGDIYDCVDFYKQPAFDHPMMKNRSVRPRLVTKQALNIQIPKSIQNSVKNKGVVRNITHVKIGFKNDRCPLGTVPLRRVTKADLIRERLASKRVLAENGAEAKLVVLRTNGTTNLTGAGAYISINNPSVSNGQYSAARLKLISGSDSIEAGWRVDPTLYGDTKTRFYLRTDVGETHCFNTLCPGFFYESRDTPIDFVFDNISEYGGDTYVIPVSIVQNYDGYWSLTVGENNVEMGSWPVTVFKEGAQFRASYAEWGGEAYSPPGEDTPPMGSGYFVSREDSNFDACFGQVTEYHEINPTDRPDDVVTFKNSQGYSIIDEGYVDDYHKHVFFYGGPGELRH